MDGLLEALVAGWYFWPNDQHATGVPESTEYNVPNLIPKPSPTDLLTLHY